MYGQSALEKVGKKLERLVERTKAKVHRPNYRRLARQRRGAIVEIEMTVPLVGSRMPLESPSSIVWRTDSPITPRYSPGSPLPYFDDLSPGPPPYSGWLPVARHADDAGHTL